MITRQIARNGMRGRKKVSILLAFVLMFTFLFITVSITLETSISQTKQSQRNQLYGEWQAAYMGADDEVVSQIEAQPEVSDVAVSTIVGKIDSLGTIATISDELIDMGNFVLQEGSYPTEKNEILIESSIADELGFEDPIGQTVSMKITNNLVSIDRSLYEQQREEELGIDTSERGSGKYFKHQIFTTEYQGDFWITLTSQYFYVESGQNQTSVSPELIKQDGILYNQEISLSKDYVICGVIDTYSGFWDTGDYDMGNIFVTSEEEAEIIDVIRGTTLIDLKDYENTSNVFLTSDSLGSELYDSLKGQYLTQEEQEEEERGSIPFRKNTFTYPSVENSTEYTLTLMVIAIIFVVTACAILQIFLTQIKKRTRKIALLKCIGTTNRQVVQILMWEGIYLLIYSMPLGVIAGFFSTYGIIAGLNRWAGMDISFYLDIRLMVVGVVTGCLSLFVGMAVPMVKAMHVPLVGSITVTKKKRKKSIREQLNQSKGVVESRERMLTFHYITKQHNRLNRNNIILTQVLTVITAVITLTSLLLGYLSFRTYLNDVVKAEKPSYVLKAEHGYDSNELEWLIDQITEDSSLSVTTYKAASQIYVKYDAILDSPLINAYKQLVPDRIYSDYLGEVPVSPSGVQDDTSMIEDSIITMMYGINPGDQIYENIMDIVTDGEIDETSFEQGESVIVAIPIYHGLDEEESYERMEYESIPSSITATQMFHYILKQGAGIDTSYDWRYSNAYEKDTSLKVGDTIAVSQELEIISANPTPICYNTSYVKVGGIIYYNPEDGIYPLFEDNNGFVVIGSNLFFNSVCPSATYNPLSDYSEDSKTQFEYKLQQRPTNYGETYLNVYTSGSSYDISSASQLFLFAKNNYMEFYNYAESNWALYCKALNSAMVIVILGVASLFIAGLILYNINMSAFDQERSRIGVLQALGVTNREFAKTYFMTGVRNGFVALLVSHIVLAISLVIMEVSSINGVRLTIFEYGKDLLNSQLGWYPWWAHILICIVFYLMVIVINYIPVRQLKKYSPNENISC